MKLGISLMIGLFMSQTLFISQTVSAHESVIRGVMEHSHYLEEAQVKSFGDLRLIRENQLNQSFPYSKIKSDDLYGIGMPKGLDKELMITSGNLYEGYFDQNQYFANLVKNDMDIAFMAYVNVKNWKTLQLPEHIKTFPQLEQSLPELAKQAGLNAQVPFPFILRAKIEGLSWFIVDGMGNGKPNHLKSFLRARYRGGLDDVDIEGMGFYSEKHKGILSAPNSSMHIHFRTLKKPLFVGHIDNQMMLVKGAIIQFPAAD